MNHPPSITENEFLTKLAHVKQVLINNESTAIYLHSEGALRWLTGVRHQVIDIHPCDATTLSVIIKVEKNSYIISFYSEQWEQNRLKDIVRAPIFQLEGITTTIQPLNALLLDQSIINPHTENYREIEREIVSPLCEGLNGNQYKKLEFLITSSREALLEIGHKLTIGMNGWNLRSLVYETYHNKHIELNQVVLSLHGMHGYQHPMVQDDSLIKKGDVIKIVTGSRYYDMIHSATQLVKIDSPVSEREHTIYEALQQMSITYASQFTTNKTEKELYASLTQIAQHIEKEYNIPHFSESAHIHHAGGPISPLGNRDFVITKNGMKKLLPYAQFSINPVDSILNLKCELQGIVIPHDLPIILDEFSHITNKNEYMMVQYNGKDLRLPTIITNSEGYEK